MFSPFELLTTEKVVNGVTYPVGAQVFGKIPVVGTPEYKDYFEAFYKYCGEAQEQEITVRRSNDGKSYKIASKFFSDDQVGGRIINACKKKEKLTDEQKAAGVVPRDLIEKIATEKGDGTWTWSQKYRVVKTAVLRTTQDGTIIEVKVGSIEPEINFQGDVLTKDQEALDAVARKRALAKSEKDLAEAQTKINQKAVDLVLNAKNTAEAKEAYEFLTMVTTPKVR